MLTEANAIVAVRNVRRHLRWPHLFDHSDWVRDVTTRDSLREYLAGGGKLPKPEQALLAEADVVFEAHAAVAWREMKRSSHDLDADPDAYWHRLRTLAEEDK